MTETNTRTSLFTVLEIVQKRPGMYLGYSDSERGAQLRSLEMLIAGCYQALIVEFEAVDRFTAVHVSQVIA